MALPRFASDTVTIKRAASIIDRGVEVWDWDNATTHEITGCSVQFRETSTAYDSREAVSLRAVIYLPPGSDIQAGDKVVFDGVDYAIGGAPLPQKSPTGRTSHIKASLVDWRG